MKNILYAVKPFLWEITHNFLLAVCIIEPIIMGCLFKFVIPELENVLCNYFGLEQIMAPYYIVFDLLLVVLTPIIFCVAGILVILEELDCGTAKYYAVTPVGKSGYLLSRIGIPTVVAFVYDVVLLSIFSISDMNLFLTIVFSICGVLLAIITSLIVVTYAKNKMSGMGLVKLCSLLVIGIPAAYFVPGTVRYLFGVFPSFWMAEFCMTNNTIFLIPVFVVSVAVIIWLYRSFEKRLL